METITVNSLDGAYEQCSSLVNHINGDGLTLLNDLIGTVKSLKGNWIGNDASKHINNLMKVYDGLHALLSDAKGYVCFAGSRVIAMQQVRSANGGGGNVGEYLNSEELEHIRLPECQPTNEYKVEPAAANDLTSLQKECEQFDSFMSKFLEIKTDLMSNWSAGARREKAEECFEELAQNSESYKKMMAAARENLETAVANIGKLEG